MLPIKSPNIANAYEHFYIYVPFAFINGLFLGFSLGKNHINLFLFKRETPGDIILGNVKSSPKSPQLVLKCEYKENSYPNGKPFDDGWIQCGGCRSIFSICCVSSWGKPENCGFPLLKNPGQFEVCYLYMHLTGEERENIRWALLKPFPTNLRPGEIEMSKGQVGGDIAGMWLSTAYRKPQSVGAHVSASASAMVTGPINTCVPPSNGPGHPTKCLRFFHPH